LRRSRHDSKGFSSPIGSLSDGRTSRFTSLTHSRAQVTRDMSKARQKANPSGMFPRYGDRMCKRERERAPHPLNQFIVHEMTPSPDSVSGNCLALIPALRSRTVQYWGTAPGAGHAVVTLAAAAMLVLAVSRRPSRCAPSLWVDDGYWILGQSGWVQDLSPPPGCQ
jgi:hypothetical protein